MCMGVLAYRDGLPLLMRTCFYPLLGKHTWGWIGDVIDGFTIVTIVAGVCTSLGLGTIQIKTGLLGVNALPEDCISGTGKAKDDCLKNSYVLIIWIITLFATISVVSGLKVGIKRLSQLAFGCGVFLLVSALFFDNTYLILDSTTQMVGYYLQYSFTTLGWATDAFARMSFGQGGTPDKAGVGSNPISDIPHQGGQGADPGFMNGWTIFYWGWWIAWSPFVGMFVSRISRGRTIREVFMYTLTAPLLFGLIWFGVFGTAAIEMENNAQLLWQAGADLYGDPTHFQVTDSSFYQVYGNTAVSFRKEPCFGTNCGRCGTWGFNETVVNNCKFVSGEWMYHSKTCVPRCSEAQKVDFPFQKTLENNGVTLNELKNKGVFRDSGNVCIPDKANPGDGYGCGACFKMPKTFEVNGVDGCTIFSNNPANKIKMPDGHTFNLPCPNYIKDWNGRPEIGPVCLFTDWDQESSWYNVVNQYGGSSLFLCGLSIFTLVIYFVTSSDSGSLVVDTISGNGRDEQNPLQRVFWAFTEGAVATALVLSGDSASDSKTILKSLQAASICAGLPFTFLLCLMMPSFLYALRNKQRKDFTTPIYGGIFDSMEWFFTFGQAPLPPNEKITDFFLYLICPFLGIYKIQDLLGGSRLYDIFLVSAGTVCWITWILLLAISKQVWIYGWLTFFVFACVVMLQRGGNQAYRWN